MTSKYLRAPAFALAMSLTGAAAWAGAVDYAFEPVAPELKKGDDVVDRRPPRCTSRAASRCADAVIVRTRVDMAPDGMADMVSPVAAGTGRRAWRLCLQDRSADGRPIPAEPRRQGAGRAGDGGRQGHLQSRQVRFVCTATAVAAAALRDPTFTAW